MYTQIKESKSFNILKITIASIIVLLASLAGAFPHYAVLYFLFTVLGSVLLARINHSKELKVSLISVLVLLLLAHSLLSILWTNNREGNLGYIVILGIVFSFSVLLNDYLSGFSKKDLVKSVMSLFLIGGALCAVANLVYWSYAMVPVGDKSKMSLGFGNSDFLALYMLGCIVVSSYFLKSNSKKIVKAMVVFVLLLLFIFLMSSSSFSFIVAILFSILVLIRRKYEKVFFSVSLVCAGIVFLMAFCKIFYGNDGFLFRETFGYGIRSFFGKGGGFLQGKELFLTSAQRINSVGIVIHMTVASGVLGLLLSSAFVYISLSNFIKQRSNSSLFMLLITPPVLFFPSVGICGLLLFVGGLIFSMFLSDSLYVSCVKLDSKKFTKRITVFGSVICLITFVFFCGSIIRSYADSLYKDKKYLTASQYYKTAASFNPADARSCKMAAISIRKGGSLQENKREAHRLIDRAINREPENLSHLEEKALLYELCNEYVKAEKIYKKAADAAKFDGKYNLNMARAIFFQLEELPKGSQEATILYEKIALLGKKTSDLIYKKQINDFADKAVLLTKGEPENEK